ncbi:MAG: GNAT family N-acetyltransferase [Chloroflexi bacterium]|nr:MAG: GNAT family N-acetyltransferase [Chloroflexota bacterium]TMG39046.1 MAG: GNAT family N-acetyltransferase [Chloroflexota bacterium]
MEIREFRVSDAPALRALWARSGIRIRPGDDDVSLGLFAARNPGLFLVGLEEQELVASALAGWDGRRGWLYHVAVSPERRRRGIAVRLVRMLEERLRVLGCKKVNLIVWEDSADAMRFWASIGYQRERAIELSKVLE